MHSKCAILIAFFLGCLCACKSDSDDEQQPAVIMPVEMAYSTGLPVVVINTPDSCPIASKTEWVEDAEMTLCYTDGQKQQLSKTSIRGHGNVTWVRYPKKAYSLKLDKKTSLAGMKAAKRWVLLANWADRTLLRNDVAFEIARHTSLEWTPSGTFVELVLNGNYVGSYYLCEKIQIGKNRLNITEMNYDDDSEEAITGGYLMEIDTYFDEVFKFRSAVYNLPYQFRNPDEETLSKKMFDYMQQYVNQMELLLSDDQSLQSGRHKDYIDLQSFADWWIVNELCFNKDVAKFKSIYVYKERGKVLKAGPVWDFDFSTFTPCDEIYLADKFPYIQRLLQTQDFRQIVSERWGELRPALDAIPDYIDSKVELLRVSEEQNIQMWPIGTKSNGDGQLTYQEAIDRMKQSFLLRVQVLDDYIRTLMPYFFSF